MKFSPYPKDWSDLDPSKPYCLVDTMVLLTMCDDSGEITANVKGALDGSTMILIPQVLQEAAGVHRRNDPDRRRVDKNEFAAYALSRVVVRFGTCGIAIPEREAVSAAGLMYAKRKYVNSDNVPLSYIDCLLLCVAMRNPNVTLLTEDLMLVRAACSECGFLGSPRTRHAMQDYYRRRNQMALFIRRAAGGRRVEAVSTQTGTKYAIDDSWCVIIDDQSPVASARVVNVRGDGAPCLFGDIPAAIDAILAAWDVHDMDVCICESHDITWNGCACGDFRYGDDLDSGFDELEARQFLYSLGRKERNEIAYMTSRAESFHYRLCGPVSPMGWPKGGQRRSKLHPRAYGTSAF